MAPKSTSPTIRYASRVRAGTSDLPLQKLRRKSVQIRRETFLMCHRAKCGHLGSSFSIVDILTVLYFHHLRVDPRNPRDPDRDRFILSKGHGCASIYVALAHRGFFAKKRLESFIQDGSIFAGHPSSLLVPGIEASTGSLGHGLSIGLGIALAGKRGGKTYRTVVMISDGECNEGATWEAVLAAPQWKLSRLTCIVDYNKIQSFGRTSEVMELDPLADKWRSFGWHTQEIDGHDHRQIAEALTAADACHDKPSVIIAHTVKGKGVSFMEDTVDWHYWTPNDNHLKQALSELCLP